MTAADGTTHGVDSSRAGVIGGARRAVEPRAGPATLAAQCRKLWGRGILLRCLLQPLDVVCRLRQGFLDVLH